MHIIYFECNLKKKDEKFYFFFSINKNQITKAKQYQLYYKLLFSVV